MTLRTAALLLSLAAGACVPAYQPPLRTLPSPQQLPPPPMTALPPDTLPALPPENPLRAASSALKAGLVTPRKAWFKGLAYVPPYHPNHGYLVYAAEGMQTNLEFARREIPLTATCQDGGVIVSLAWTQTGSGASEAWILQAKPRMIADGNGLVRCSITTSRGPYTVFLKTMPAGSPAHIATVRWDDPYGFLAPDNGAQSAPVCRGSDVNYRVTGDLGAFGLTSASVSNDGAQTCIRFPPSAGFDLPAAWLVEGESERPASPATINGAYLIDGVPPVIELRTDHARLRIERLERTAP